MQLCLLGGTFDPPHWGHLLLAEYIRSEHDINKIVFIPAYIPPHKQESEISATEHRLEMIELVCKTNSHFAVDVREIRRKGVSYTIDTVQSIKKDHNLLSHDIGLLIGADNFRDLSNWRAAEDLVRECQVLVVARPDYPVTANQPFYSQVRVIETPLIGLSSSQIRNRVREGKSITYFVLPWVESYIRDNNLYR